MERERNRGLSLLCLLVVLSLIVVAIVVVADYSFTLWETHAYYLPYKREVFLPRMLAGLREMPPSFDSLTTCPRALRKEEREYLSARVSECGAPPDDGFFDAQEGPSGFLKEKRRIVDELLDPACEVTVFRLEGTTFFTSPWRHGGKPSPSERLDGMSVIQAAYDPTNGLSSPGDFVVRPREAAIPQLRFLITPKPFPVSDSPRPPQKGDQKGDTKGGHKRGTGYSLD
jgi:hypothetical protein